MATFKELYRGILEDTAKKVNLDVTYMANTYETFDPNQLDCLFNPSDYPVHWKLSNIVNPDGTLHEGVKASKDTISVLRSLHDEQEKFAFVLVAPAFLGQFSEKVTPGMLRNAFKRIGFDGLVEVAIFADILTLKEALEFDHNILTESDYQLTSCCCPMWIAMIRKIYADLMPHVPATVSPMIAAGRTVKILHPNATTVFIGPCVAKKAEAKEAGLAGAIDHVLTFQETQEIFDILNIDPEKMEDSVKEFSSTAGRMYARTGGVSEAVKATVERLNPNRKIAVNTKQANGVIECKAMIEELLTGKSDANFFEGMGCIGGCVGGPKAMISKEEAKSNVEKYAEQAAYRTPIDNPYVIELLSRLGFETPESLMEDNRFFTRKF